jgi:tetratricopeptide (TPR) repeat protein
VQAAPEPVDDSGHRGRRPWPDGRWVVRAWQRWTIAIVVLLLLALVVLRRPLADRIWPEDSGQALRDRAAKALARGELSNPDGTGARELYDAALAVDPDGNGARIGLMRVASAALARARADTAAGHYAQAHRNLQLAVSLSVPAAQADAVAARLRDAEAQRVGIDNLLAQAALARAAHRLDGSPDAALPLYQRILAMQPDRVEALEGREDALSDLLQQARHALDRDDLVTAARLVAAARGYDSGHADLPDVQARLATGVERLNRDAQSDLRAGRLARAMDRYHTLLQIDPDQASARSGLDQIALAWAHRAERAAADFRFTEAEQALAQARSLQPGLGEARVADRAIARARRAKATLRPATPPRERTQRVRRLLDEAAAAEARGDLLTPPGDSAFDKLRAARALAPDDRNVRRAEARLLPIARECFDRELLRNNLGGAGACLDARIALDGDTRRIATDRRRLAVRWLAIGDERLGAGDAKGAADALAHTRALDPHTPGIASFQQRLRAAAAVR